MAMVFQLDMFEAPEDTELKALREWVTSLKESQDRVRKGMFARLNEVGKDVIDLKDRLEIIERHICRSPM